MEELLLTSRAILIMLTGDNTGAASIFRSSMKIAEEMDDKEGIVENSKYLTEIMLEQNEISKAEEMNRCAIDISIKSGLGRELAQLETALALVKLRGNLPVEEAVKQLEKALTTRIKNGKNLPDIYRKGSEICKELADSQAVSSRKALRLRRESENWRNASRSEIMKTADMIKSDQYRESFMHNIPLHHRILTATP